MQSILINLQAAMAGGQWLIAASLILAVLLAVRMVRYRRLYLASLDEQRNGRDLIDNLSEGIYRSTMDGRILTSNPALAQLNGCESADELLSMVYDIGREWYVEPGRRVEFRRTLFRDGKIRDFVSEVYRYKSRERIWVSEAARLVRDPKSGRPLYYEGSVREITETVKRLQLEEVFQKLTNQVPGGLFQIVRHKGAHYTMPYASNGLRELIALDGPAVEPHQLLELVDPEDCPAFVESLRRSRMTLDRWDCEFRITDRAGQRKWLRITATPESVEDGIMWHGYVADISRRKENEMAIERLAFHDSLTELPNRRAFLDRLNAAARRCARRSTHAALLFVDLDNFKNLNDTHGHHAGDSFLKQVADRLANSMSDEDVVARIGGDEFVVLVEDAGNDYGEAAQKVLMTANRLLSALRRDFDLGQFRHVATASIGVVVFDGSEQAVDEILNKADKAMYHVKAAGRDGIALFDGGSAAASLIPDKAPPASRSTRLIA